MLKFEHNNGETMMAVEGSLIEICADIGLMIHLIWLDLKQGNPAAADEFRQMMQYGMEDDSPAWVDKGIRPEVRMGKAGMELLIKFKKKLEKIIIKKHLCEGCSPLSQGLEGKS